MKKANEKEIKKTTVWETTRNIIDIQKKLSEGYTFDNETMKLLISAMLTFLHGVIKPEDETKET